MALLLVVGGLVSAVGCTSMAINSRAERVLDSGAAYVNLVSTSASGEELIFRTYGRVKGPEKIKIDQANTTRLEMPAQWGELGILFPSDPRDRRGLQYFLDSIDSGLSTHALEAIGVTINRLPHVREYRIALDFLFAAEGSGYYVSDKTTDLGEGLELSFVALVSPLDAGLGVHAPWVNAVRVAAHELAHIEYHLRRDHGSVAAPNREAAAELMAWCSHSDFLVEADILDVEERMVLGNQERVQAAFPGLSEGRFDPKMEHIDSGQDPAYIGALLARAIVYTQVEDGRINLARPSTRAFLEERCSSLPSRIPDYMNGEW